MDKRKKKVTILGFVSILVMAVWLLGFVTQARAETVKFKGSNYVARWRAFRLVT